MATTSEYCVRQDIIDRLSEVGIDYTADDDNDGVTIDSEKEASIDRSIRSAAGEINVALINFFTVPISQNTNNLNSWLRDRAIDLAAEDLVARKGGDVPDSFKEAAERTRKMLEKVSTGEIKVPELSYPGDSYTEQIRRMGTPRAVNPRPLRSRLGRKLGQ